MDPSVYNTLRLVSPDPSDTFIDFAIYLLIGTGSFIFIAGFLGCCGALRENKCMLGLVSKSKYACWDKYVKAAWLELVT
jgi:hypothetical protein